MPTSKVVLDPMAALTGEVEKLAEHAEKLDRLLSSVDARLGVIESETLPAVKTIAKDLRAELGQAKHDMKSIKQLVTSVMDFQDNLAGTGPAHKGKGKS